MNSRTGAPSGRATNPAAQPCHVVRKSARRGKRPSNLTNGKIFILYDILQIAGSAERLPLTLAEALPGYRLVVSRVCPEAAALDRGIANSGARFSVMLR